MTGGQGEHEMMRTLNETNDGVKMNENGLCHHSDIVMSGTLMALRAIQCQKHSRE